MPAESPDVLRSRSVACVHRLLRRIRSSISLILPSAMAVVMSAQAGQDVLPEPPVHYSGKVGRTYLDSDPPRFPQPVQAPKGAPNVVVIMLDDVGYGQFSVSGGLVPSPALEKLRKEGLFYNRFHTTALCSPTRASLLTGRNPQSVGAGVVAEMATGYDGYTGIIQKDTATVAEVLREHGYATAMIGKNHNTPPWEASQVGPFDRWPSGLGFDYFYGFNGASTNQFQPLLYENHSIVRRTYGPGYILSADLADHAIAWVEQEQAIAPDKPYFLYVAPAATHAPHQALPEDIARFKGQFDMGWDRYREQVFARQKELGVIPQDARLTPRPAVFPAWDSLEPDQQRLYAHMMEVFAAYGYEVDREMGRLLDALQRLPGWDNTLVLYLVGDNGASAEGGPNGTFNEESAMDRVRPSWQDMLKVMDQLGSAKYYNHFPSAWAWAMDTPFQWNKQVASHLGGIRNPLIVVWPDRIKQPGGLRTQFAHVSDIMPTILEAAGITAPVSVDGVAQKPLDGISMLYSFNDAAAKDQRTQQVFELFGNRGMYQDGWFASSMLALPWDPNRTKLDPDKARWELYDLNQDYSQSVDLAQQDPDKLRQMEDLWWAQAGRTGILPLDWRVDERFNRKLQGRPSLSGDRTRFVYDSPISGVPEEVAPNFKNRSWEITVDADVTQGQDGMLITEGGRTCGFALYVKDGRLTYDYNFSDTALYRVAAPAPLPSGPVKLAARFDYDGKAPGDIGKGGLLELSVNGHEVARGRVERTCGVIYSFFETMDIGLDLGSPVSDAYTPPFDFSGKIKRVTVQF